MPPKQCYRTPPTCPARHISPPCSPPSRPLVFGWLLCVDLPIGGRFTQPCILFSLFLRSSIQRPKQWDNVSPHAPPPVCHLSRLPLTANADTRLVVGSFFKVLAQGRPHCSFLWGFRRRSKQRNQPWRRQNCWCKPCVDSLEEAAPRVGAVAAVAMAIEGKATGG